ncbi:MAG TPA: 2-phosphosulfolactate phosphatase [Solirubrobacteraceae bacterium]|nr:2-phosphosulfolactate phosphatase [Solirubrobacteraceae bacterium]
MIDVAFTRADLRAADVSVVIDVLRATSTATQALAGGYEAVRFVDTLERARALRGPDRILAGERSCVMPSGFDQGNSPLEALRPRGSELVLTTTNGAPTAVAAVEFSPRVLLGCLLNLDAVIRALQQVLTGGAARLQLVCSGTNGEPALEDAYMAGRIAHRLSGPRTDAALIAEAVAERFPTALEALSASEDAQVLRDAGLEGDIAHCAMESSIDLVPVLNRDRDEVVARVSSSWACQPLEIELGGTVSV